MKAKNVIIDSATLYYTNENISDVGANIETIKRGYFATAKSTVSVAVKPNIREIDFAGKNERKVKDANRILGWEVSSSFETIDFIEGVLTSSLFEKSNTSNAKLDKFVPKTNIESGDYKNLIIVGKVQGTNEPCICVIKNSFNEEGLQFSYEDGNEGANTMTFHGYYDDSEVVPFEFYTPKITSTLSEE